MGYTELGRMIRSKRILRGMSQGELANALGISRSNVSSLETGRIHGLDPEMAHRLSRALDIPVPTILEAIGYDLQDRGEAYPQDVRVQELARALDKLPEQEKRRLFAVIEALVGEPSSPVQ